MHVMTRLLGCAALFATVAPGLAAQGPDGQALYREHCKECHGAAGRPPKTAVAKYKDVKTFDAPFFTGRSDDSLLAVLKRGVKDGKEMKSFKEKLSPEEMVAVVKYIRTRFAGGAAAEP